jgi:7-cyano-7-deazaguanine synthase
MEKRKNALVLCSGGLDSVVTAYFVKNKLKYNKLKILFFDYGQRAIKQERNASKRCAKDIGAEFEEIKLNWLGKISNSLINKSGNVKKLKKGDLKDTKEESEKYYVPCRNTVFLVYALAIAEASYIKTKEKNDIFVGFKCEGKESYPDTTKKFVEEITRLSKIGCSTKFDIKAPLIDKDKEDIVLLGRKLGMKMDKTFSCYAPKKGKHCGYCLACMLRKQGFYWANVKDSTTYQK